MGSGGFSTSRAQEVGKHGKLTSPRGGLRELLRSSEKIQILLPLRPMNKNVPMVAAMTTSDYNSNNR